MSKERELLESCLAEMQYHSLVCPELKIEIKEPLAQPEGDSFFHYECTGIADVFDVFRTGSYERILTVQGKHNLNLVLQLLDSSPTLGMQMLDTNLWSALRITKLLTQPEQTVQEQEPVAWMYDHHIEVGYDKYTEFNIVETCARNLESENCINIRPLYTSPQKREPLSEDEIVALWANKSPANEFECVRLVEKAHGITGVADE